MSVLPSHLEAASLNHRRSRYDPADSIAVQTGKSAWRVESEAGVVSISNQKRRRITRKADATLLFLMNQIISSASASASVDGALRSIDDIWMVEG
jgi:hypothetical protein